MIFDTTMYDEDTQKVGGTDGEEELSPDLVGEDIADDLDPLADPLLVGEIPDEDADDEDLGLKFDEDY